jgi:hypothetical protein
MQLEVRLCFGKNWHMDYHLSMDKEHYASYSGKIYRKGSVLDGKTLIKEVITPIKNGKFGKPKIGFSIKGEEQCFDTIDELINFYEGL